MQFVDALNSETDEWIWWNSRYNTSISLSVSRSLSQCLSLTLYGLWLLHNSFFIMMKMTKNRTISMPLSSFFFFFFLPFSKPIHHIISKFLFIHSVSLLLSPSLSVSLAHISQPPGVYKRMWFVINYHFQGIFCDFSVDSPAQSTAMPESLHTFH